MAIKTIKSATKKQWKMSAALNKINANNYGHVAQPASWVNTCSPLCQKKTPWRAQCVRKAWSNRPILNQSPGRSTPGETLCLPTPGPFPKKALPKCFMQGSTGSICWHFTAGMMTEGLGLRQSALVRLAQWAPCKRKAKVVVKPFYSVLPLDTQRIPGTYNMSKVSKGIIWYHWYCPKRDPKKGSNITEWYCCSYVKYIEVIKCWFMTTIIRKPLMDNNHQHNVISSRFIWLILSLFFIAS